MITDIQVRLSPDSASPGSTVTAEATVVGDTAQVAGLRAMVREYGFYEVFTPADEGQYRLRTTVPWDAPYGTYRVAVCAESASGGVLKEGVVPFRVA